MCQLGEQDVDGIVRLNTDFLICIKYIVLRPNMGKMTTKFNFVQLLRNRCAEWYVICRDNIGFDVVVQHAPHF
jgi:hypothetical protein